jgi:hypothetical protein
MIKSYRRSGPKGKMTSALPLLALGLGFYVIAKSGKAKPPALLQSVPLDESLASVEEP